MRRRFFAMPATGHPGGRPLRRRPRRARACLQDLRALPGFLLENDTGARQHLAQKGQAYFDQALASASAAAASANDEAACNVALSENIWASGAKAICRSCQSSALRQDKAGTGAATAGDQAVPVEGRRRCRLLASHTALLTLPSFFPAVRQRASQTLLASKREELAAGPTGSSM